VAAVAEEEETEEEEEEVAAAVCLWVAADAEDEEPVAALFELKKRFRVRVKGALQLLSNRSKLICFAQVPERNSVSSSDRNLSAIYP